MRFSLHLPPSSQKILNEGPCPETNSYPLVQETVTSLPKPVALLLIEIPGGIFQAGQSK